MIAITRRMITLLILVTICCGMSRLAIAVDTLVAPMVTPPPVIDGTIGEMEWALALGTEVTPETGSWDFGETVVSYTFFVMYDSDYLYVAARFVDDDIQIDSAAEGSMDGQTWMDDSVEIFVDGNHNRAADAFDAAETPFGGQHVITANNAVRFTDGVSSFGNGPDDDYYAVADIKSDTVWEVEARLKLSLFGSPQPGDTVGFNISTNDDDGGGGEESALFWTGEPPSIYSNEAAWGDLVFGESAAVSPTGKLAATWGQIREAD
ncbi:sugar-binding protein [Candidatus Poribacteria bacterium]